MSQTLSSLCVLRAAWFKLTAIIKKQAEHACRSCCFDNAPFGLPVFHFCPNWSHIVSAIAPISVRLRRWAGMAMCRLHSVGLTEVDIGQRAHSDTNAQPYQQLQFRPCIFPVLSAKHADNVGHEPEFHGFEKVVPVFKQQHIQQHGGEKRGGNGKNHGVLLWGNKWCVDVQAAFGELLHLKSSLYFVSDRRAARVFAHAVFRLPSGAERMGGKCPPSGYNLAI